MKVIHPTGRRFIDRLRLAWRILVNRQATIIPPSGESTQEPLVIGAPWTPNSLFAGETLAISAVGGDPKAKLYVVIAHGPNIGVNKQVTPSGYHGALVNCRNYPPLTQDQKDDCVLPEDFLENLMRQHDGPELTESRD